MSKISELNPRQKKFLKYYVETGNGALSARKAGYADDQVTPYVILGNARFQAAYHELMDKKGLTDEKLLDVLNDGLKANKTISSYSAKDADASTNDFIDVPDYATRHKYLETGLKLKKHMESDNEESLQRAIINIIRFEDKSGNPIKEVSGRLHIQRSPVSRDGKCLGNGKELVRDSKSS